MNRRYNLFTYNGCYSIAIDLQVHRHIKQIGMPWAVGVTKWFVCIFAEVLPTETVLRIWDCIFYEGSKVVFRVALALIRMHRNEILESTDLGEMVTCFRSMGNHSRVLDCHLFISVSSCNARISPQIRKVLQDIFKIPSSFSNKTLEALRLKHSKATSS